MSEFPTFTESERDQILAMPKAIGEIIRWIPQKDARPFQRYFRVDVIPLERPSFQREIRLFGESYRSRTGRFNWSIGLQISGLRPNLIRFDSHDNPHRNRQDGSIVTGCMMHLWNEVDHDRHAISARGIVDCSSVESALINVLTYCNITHDQALQKRFGDDLYG